MQHNFIYGHCTSKHAIHSFAGLTEPLLSYAIFTECHQYWRTDGLVGTGLMPYKAHSLKYQHFMLFPVPVYSKYEIWNSLLNYM